MTEGLSPMEQLAQDLAKRRGEAEQETVTETVVTETVVTETPTEVVETTETTVVTPTEEQTKRTFSDIVNETPTEADPKEKELEAKILEKYKDKFSVLSKLEQSEALKFVVENWDDIDHESMFAKDKTDYSKLTPFDIHLEVARQNGIQISPEDMEVERKEFEAKLEDMTPIQRELYKKELLAKLPQPKDNSSYLQKEKERKAALAQENQAKAKQEEAYWQSKQEFAMQLKDKLVGIEMPNIGVTVTKEMVENAYGKLAKSWGSPRYFDDKGDYRPELEIEDLLYAEIGRNAHMIFSQGELNGKVKQQQERQNATTGQAPQNSMGSGLSEEQIQERARITAVYGNNPELMQVKLKEKGLI